MIKNDNNHWLSFWQEELAIGKPLPTLPLWLRDDICLPVELQSSYDRVCRDLKLNDVLKIND